MAHRDDIRERTKKLNPRIETLNFYNVRCNMECLIAVSNKTRIETVYAVSSTILITLA